MLALSVEPTPPPPVVCRLPKTAAKLGSTGSVAMVVALVAAACAAACAAAALAEAVECTVECIVWLLPVPVPGLVVRGEPKATTP